MSKELLPTITNKQKRFIQEYSIDHKGTAAAIRAGYSKGRASQIAWNLLDKPHVKIYLEEIEKAAAERSNVTKDYLTLKLKDLVDSHSVRPSDKISAIVALAKMHGFMSEKQIDQSQVVIIKQTGLSDEEIVPTIDISSE